MTVTFNPARAVDQMPPAPEKLYIADRLRKYFEPDNGLLPDPIDIRLEGHSKPRAFSGWFSPSVHPTMSLRDLTRYAMDPANFERPPFEPDVQVSAFMGTIFHVVANRALLDLGMLVKPEGKKCPMCGRPRGYKPGVDQCNEYPVSDPVLQRRGHIDDVVDVPELGGPVPVDIKSCAPHALNSINDHDPKPFVTGKTALKAQYYGQFQEYSDLFDASEYFIVVYMSLGFPWRFKEIVFKRDREYSAAVKEKYRKARWYAARGELPPGN